MSKLLIFKCWGMIIVIKKKLRKNVKILNTSTLHSGTTSMTLPLENSTKLVNRLYTVGTDFKVKLKKCNL